MKNLLIILGMTAALGIGGFIVAAEVTRRCQLAARPVWQSALPADADPMARLAESAKEASEAMDLVEVRGRNGLIAGGISALLGAAGGIFLVSRMDRKRKTRASDQPACPPE